MLNELAQEINTNAHRKGFYDNDKALEKLLIGEVRIATLKALATQKLALVITEISEAIEALRNSHVADLDLLEGIKDNAIENVLRFTNTFEFYVKDTLEDEIADSIIRLLDFCYQHDINIDEHIKLKMLYNETRDYKHGKEF